MSRPLTPTCSPDTRWFAGNGEDGSEDGDDYGADQYGE